MRLFVTTTSYKYTPLTHLEMWIPYAHISSVPPPPTPTPTSKLTWKCELESIMRAQRNLSLTSCYNQTFRSHQKLTQDNSDDETRFWRRFQKFVQHLWRKKSKMLTFSKKFLKHDTARPPFEILMVFFHFLHSWIINWSLNYKVL